MASSKVTELVLKKITEKANGGKEIKEILIERLSTNPYQPRIKMDSKEIEELAESIKKNGLLQPILVNRNADGTYTIIAGHRRVAAHKLLGKKMIKAIIYKNTPKKLYSSYAIVENFQRENLNVIELAIALKRYKEEFNKSIKEIAADIGKDESVVSRLIGLLNLPSEIIADIQKNKSTSDVRALADINALSKKLVMTNFNIEELQKSLYYGLLEHGREWLKSEIKRTLSKIEEQEKRKNPIKIKRDKRRGVTFHIRIPQLNEEKIKEIEKVILEILEKS